MKYITVNEASEKWNISTRRICILCKEERIPGAKKMSRVWMIPENAKKPQDARKTTETAGVSALYLVFNPDYFESHGIKPTPEEKTFCDIQKKFLSGDLAGAYSDFIFNVGRCKNPQIKRSLLFFGHVIASDMGDAAGISDAFGKWKNAVENDENNQTESMILKYFLGEIESLDGYCMYGEEYNDIMPLISIMIAKKTLTRLIRQGGVEDISGLEIICEEIAQKNSPLLSAYFHLYLAVYYNILSNRAMFDYHFKKAVSILLPRKWFTPLAEYSMTIDMSYINELDHEAYLTVMKLSEKITRGYINIGLFDAWISIPKKKSYETVQVAFKIVQGKTYNEIATELNISTYKVKQYLTDLCDSFGLNSKKEIRDFILRNIII